MTALRPLQVAQFKGGQSNPTLLLTAGGRNCVMRRKPPGKLLPSAHAVDRECHVISALAQTDVPVAKAHALCTDETVTSTMFYVMDCEDGRVLWDSALPGMTPAERGAIFDEMNRVIARYMASISMPWDRPTMARLAATSSARSGAGASNTAPPRQRTSKR
jgi:aminoglycoside phosphotransferase (APT) family kinase protein